MRKGVSMAAKKCCSAGLLLVAAVAVSALTACSGSATAGESPSADEPKITAAASDLPTEPASSGTAREVYTVETWDDVIATSDLVVVGQATSVAPGRGAGSDVGGRLGFRDVEVHIEDVLAGSFDGTSLTLEELGWKEGQPFTVNQARWAMPGDRMLMGLKVTDNGASATGPRYILTSSASRFFLDEAGEVSTNYLDSGQANSFVTSAADLSATELISAVAAEAGR